MTTPEFRLHPDPDTLAPVDMVAAEFFTTDNHTELNALKFQTEDEKVLCGVWECAPTREVIDAYPVHEMMTVISGVLVLTHPDGRTETFTAGDTFFIAKGSQLVWEITETLRKYYLIVE
ncbi:MAG: cupin domain-containing protein [Pseudomonadota bacterium]